MRQASIERNTRETRLAVRLTLEGQGQGEIRTPSVSSLICWMHFPAWTFRPGGRCRGGPPCRPAPSSGRLRPSHRHRFQGSPGRQRGINRAGYFVFPMDEALAVVAVDISGRPYLQWTQPSSTACAGKLDTDVLPDFFQGFVQGWPPMWRSACPTAGATITRSRPSSRPGARR